MLRPVIFAAGHMYGTWDTSQELQYMLNTIHRWWRTEHVQVARVW
jgi:hypothetical protein